MSIGVSKRVIKASDRLFIMRIVNRVGAWQLCRFHVDRLGYRTKRLCIGKYGFQLPANFKAIES